MAIKKKKSGGGGANWMDTYGDMVTLLLCFFVLLYSISSISEDKWKAIVQSFNPKAVVTTTAPSGMGGPFADPDVGDKNPGLSDQEAVENMMNELMKALENYSKMDGLDSAISVEQQGGRMYVSLKDKAMFYGNSSDLLPGADEILLGVCGILDKSKAAIEVIQVKGHTAQMYDDRPNETKGDRELASDRATVVTIFIQDHSNIHPARLESVGVGQWHPIGDNQGEAGKAPNRRVEIVISAKEIGSDLEKELNELTGEGGSVQQPAASPAPSQDPA